MNYIALTIGPINKTLANAKKTRELWGGSYIFSYIMKKIIEEFKDKEFIVPYIKDKSIFDSGKEVGLFHDRFIFEAKNGDDEKLKKTIDEVLNNIVKESKISKEFLQNYLQINYIYKELQEGDNPILELTPYLDTKELFYQVANYKENELEKFLKNRLNRSFLIKEAFNEKRVSFPSLPEIALYDLKDTDMQEYLKLDDELSIYEKEPYKSKIKNYHKYIAIVQADGDNMGKVIEKLKTKDDFNNFSEKLFNYCKNSHKKIKEFGGQTIFAGGDDLLFFAPVVSGDKTIFNLCEEISENFNNEFENYNTTPKPSLSFGISITYYKFPLYEALENARKLLFDKAKSKEKNNIAFKVIKHSGQTFESIIHKGNRDIYDIFLKISSSIKDGDGVDNFLHSLHHKIDTYKTTLEQISDDKDRLKNFFDNYFNNDVHKQYQEFFEQLVDFIYEIYQDDSIKKEDKLKLVYATLRFVKFVKGDKNG